MKTRSASRRQPAKAVLKLSNSLDEPDVSPVKSKRRKRIRQRDVSESSDENVSFQSRPKNGQRRRLSSDSSGSSDSSEKVEDSKMKSKKFKRIRLASDSPVSSQESRVSNGENHRKRSLSFSSESSEKSEASASESSSSRTSEERTKSRKRKRLLRNSSDCSAESADSDASRSRSDNSSCSSRESDVSARRTKRSKRIRFLRNTPNSSDDESERLDVGGLLKHKMKKLRFAVSYNNTEQVRSIIDENYVKLRSPEFGNLLWRALENKNHEIITMLMRAGVDVNVRGTGDDRENTLLHVVARKASTAHFEELALSLLDYEADIDKLDGNGNTVLHCAIESGSMVLIEKLLELGADLEAVNNMNESVLYMAALSPLAKDLLPFIVQYNAPDLEIRNNRAMEALGILVRKSGDLATMKSLLDLKVPINQKNRRNSTLLDYAVADRKSYEIVKLLLDYGADPSKKRSDGNFYLCLACSIKTCSMAALLIKNGAKIHVCNDNGQYPIHEACKYGSLQNIGLLLFLGADVNAVDNRGYTPFSLMSTYYLHDASKIMIKHFALLTSKKVHVNASDLSQVYIHPAMKKYYESCLVELENMKSLKIYNNVTAYCILARHMVKLTQLIRNKDFVKSYYENLINITNLFPIYSGAIQKLFKGTLRMRKTMVTLTDALDEATNSILPEEVWEIITSIACRDRLVDFYV